MKDKRFKTPEWYVITGGPSSGKTTIVNELAKLGYKTYPEATRAVIDRQLAKGKKLEQITKDFNKYQKQILRLAAANLKSAPAGKIVFFDRGIPDIAAYYECYGFSPKPALKYCQKNQYKKIFFFEQLKFIKDYARIENKKTATALSRCIKKTYKKLGYELIIIPAVSVKRRLKMILKEIGAI